MIEIVLDCSDDFSFSVNAFCLRNMHLALHQHAADLWSPASARTATFRGQ